MKKIFSLALVCALCIAGFWLSAQSFTQDRKLLAAEKIIETFYVTDIDTAKVVEEGIKAMLKTLDPHSTYSTPQETKELNEPLQGNFSGIGIQFQMLKDTLYVIQTTPGGPSEKVGILAGDRILAAGDSLISGVKRKNREILNILRGPKGTEVIVKVKRYGQNEPMLFRIIRDDIPINSIDAAYMVEPGIGFISLMRFGEETPREFREAVDKLRAEGMKSLIIDVQDNGGGYLQAAAEIAGMFLREGEPIVYTEGDRIEQTTFNTVRDGELIDIPVVILVNQYSASASEILSGAIQDNDRGVVIGRRTFGKGLVQRPFPFPDGSMIRLTVSRYHTPSGRCIQKPYSSGDDEAYTKDLVTRFDAGEYFHPDSIVFADTTIYHTLRLNRPLRGGGGIMPDVFVPLDTMPFPKYHRELMAKGIYNRYAAQYIDEHRQQLRQQYPTEEAFLQSFEVTPQMMDEIVAMGEADSVKRGDDFPRAEPTIAYIIKGLIGRDLFEQATYSKIANPHNPIFAKGVETLRAPGKFSKLLKPKK
ncbi:MAG: S41 family peptidase [Muribaculaceae bacterium]|nr:S41 family peptidase [Muribaculaceae bacterium]